MSFSAARLRAVKGADFVWAPVMRAGLTGVGLMLIAALGACTTAEGTNALVNPQTFEREVMTSTLQGLDLVPQDKKPTSNIRRAPLVLPKQTASLPRPTTKNDSELPTDSNNVRINAAGLSDAQLARLRNARVVDEHSLSGRPLTDAEQRQMTARMGLAKMARSGSDNRPLTLPPAEYFSLYKGKDLVCLAANGQLVTLNDPACPPKVRKALRRQGPGGGSVSSSISSEMNTLKNGNPTSGQ